MNFMLLVHDEIARLRTIPFLHSQIAGDRRRDEVENHLLREGHPASVVLGGVHGVSEVKELWRVHYPLRHHRSISLGLVVLL